VAKYHPARISRAEPRLPGVAAAERKLWNELRVQRENGLNFRRRVAIDGHTVDFLCQKAAVVVQLEHPATKPAVYDETLVRLVKNRGFAVIRVNPDEIEADAHGVCVTVLVACEDRAKS
jgi:very-short-patch-repair endonuclease